MSEISGITIIAEIAADEGIETFVRHVADVSKGINCQLILVGEDSDSVKRVTGSDAFSGIDVSFIDAGDNTSAALNRALDNAKYDIINISDTTCVYSDKSLKDIEKGFANDESLKLSCLKPRSVNVRGRSQTRISFHYVPGIIDLKKTPDLWISFLFCMFIKKGALSGIRFNEDLELEYKRAFVAEIYSVITRFLLSNENVVTSVFQDIDYYNYHPQYFHEWYTKELVMLARALVGGKTSRIKQKVMFDFIRLQFACNRNDRNKDILQPEEMDEYIGRIRDILQRIDDDIISHYDFQSKKVELPRFCGYMFLCIKYGSDYIDVDPVPEYSGYSGRKNFRSYVEEPYEFVTSNGTIVANSVWFSCAVKAMNYEGKDLVVDAELRNLFFNNHENFTVTVRGSDGSVIPTERTEVYSLSKFFGQTAQKGYTFKFTIPYSGQEKIRYKVILTFKDVEFVMPWKFEKSQSRLTTMFRNSYWNFKGNIVTYDGNKGELVIERSSLFKTFVHEMKCWYGIFKDMKDKESRYSTRAFKAIAFRFIYFLTLPIYHRKNIWVTFDQLFKGGDNGEYFYRYVNDHGGKGQTLYYVVNEDTPEYRKLSRKYRTVLKYNSIKHRLITLHTKIVFTTRAGTLQYMGYLKNLEKYFRGLFNFDIVCLQHGLSIQQIAQYQNRIYDNLKYYFCVSKYEVANLSKPIYGFDDPSILKLTGAPRYDGLRNKAVKQIIITPTWRRNVTSGTNKKGSNHEYSSNFKDTTYYKIYNRLINDEKLLNCAKENGYRLIYLIHPILSPQIGDFEANDVVEIIPGSEVNYEKILTESALMVTDHSGIMYDFAYQRKPLVYYHPDELPPQYGEGGLKYDTMGFGPVCKDNDSVVDAICDIMIRGCTIEQKYIDRINDFFEFDDFNNCERVYKAAVEFQKNRGSWRCGPV